MYDLVNPLRRQAIFLTVRTYFLFPLKIWYTRFFEMPYSLARSGTLMPAVYRARISALRSAFLGVLGDSGVEQFGEPGYSRFTSAETASSKVKIKLPSALKACGSQCPIGDTNPQLASISGLPPSILSKCSTTPHFPRNLRMIYPIKPNATPRCAPDTSRVKRLAS